MAITYPRDVPFEEFTRVDARLIRFESRNRIQGSDAVILQQRQFRPPVWQMSFTTRPHYADELKTWRAWLDSVCGPGRTCLLRDFPNDRPKLGAQGASGQYEISGISANGFTINALPPGLTLSEGDYGALIESGNRSLHRITEGGSAGGGGGLTVTVEPEISLNLFTGDAVFDFLSGSGKFIVDPATIRAEEVDIMSPVSFMATSVML